MNLLDALRGEHGPLRHELAALAAAAPPLASDQLATAALGFAAALESHAELEEELLFAPLAASGRIPAGPVEAMREEHAEIERLLAELRAEVPREPRDRALARLVEAVRAHFAHEECVLFPLATRALAAGELERAGARWAERRRVELEAGF